MCCGYIREHTLPNVVDISVDISVNILYPICCGHTCEHILPNVYELVDTPYLMM